MSLSNKFIKSTSLLDQSCRVDYFGYRGHAEKLLIRLRGTPKDSLLALVGPRGVGKSFLTKRMVELNGEDKLKSDHWLYFDTHKVSEGQKVWADFETKLSVLLKLNLLETARLNLVFMVELIQRFVFRGKKNTLTASLSLAVMLVALSALYLLSYLLVSLLVVLVLLSYIVAGTFSFTLFYWLIKYIAKKLSAKSEGGGIGELLFKVRGSKKNICVVIDGIDHIGTAEVLLLQRVRDLLDRNRSVTEMRVVLTVPVDILAGHGQSVILQHLDYLELFNPKISVDMFIDKVFADKFLKKKQTRAQCCQLLEMVLNATNQNLYVLKLVVRAAGHKYDQLIKSGVEDAPPFSCLLVSSIETMKALRVATDGSESERLIKRTIARFADLYSKEYPEAFEF